MKKQFVLFTALTLASAFSFAQVVPNTFSAGQPARAAEVNENFASLATDIDNNETAIGDLDARVTTLEGTDDPTASSVAVDCTSDSINNAISNAPAYGQLTVNISGACTETVLITRDNVTLIGATGASITYDAAITDSPYRSSLVSVINVIGADNVIISNLTLSGANDNLRAAGLKVFNNASVLISNLVLENNVAGIWVSNSSNLQMSNSISQNNSSYALIVTDSANAQIRENNTLTHASETLASLGIYRNGSVRVREGGNIITNTATNGIAVDSVHGSQFRNDNGNLTVNGAVRTAFFGQADFREATINGNLQAGPKGILRLTEQNSVTVNGDVSVSSLGFFEAFGDPSVVRVNGDVICFGYNAATYISDLTIVSGSADLNSTCNL